MENTDVNEDIKRLLTENQRLLEENNEMLRSMRRGARWALAFRIIWIAVLLGAPVALYYFVLEPNISSFQNAIDIIQQGAKNATGLQQFFQQQTPQ
jgi:hypothetical protein